MHPIVICTRTTDQEDLVTAERYLLTHRLHEEAHIISQVRKVADHTDTQHILLAQTDDEVRGVAWLNEAAEAPDYDFVTVMKVEDTEAIESIVNSLPQNRIGYFRLHQRTTRSYLSRLPGARDVHCDAYYTATIHGFRPVDGDEVVELTRDDAHLFDGCRSWAGHALDQIGIAGRRIFAIVKEGKVVTSAILGPIVTNPNRECSVAGIATLYTEEQYRRRGLGKRLVSYMTELALQGHKYVHYWTTPDNTASQALAESLGYWQYGDTVDYIWRTQCIQSTR